MRKRTISYTLVSLSILLSIYYFRSDLAAIPKKVELMVGLAAIASGVSGILMSLSASRVANFEAIREYFQQGDTPEMTATRHKIYEAERTGEPVDPKAAAEVCSFFHFWGMMVKKKYLPLWIFKSASGPSVVRLYYLVLPYIEERRSTNNPHYGEGFKYLVKRIEREYKYRYVPVVRGEEEEKVKDSLKKVVNLE